MSAMNPLEVVRVMEYVGSVLDGREASISQPPVPFIELNVQKAAAEVSAEVGVRNTQLRAPIGAISERCYVVKNAVISGGELVDFVVGENVGFRESQIPSTIGQGLIAGIAAGLASEIRQSGRNIHGCLISAKTRENLVGCRECVVDTKIEFVVGIVLLWNVDVISR